MPDCAASSALHTAGPERVVPAASSPTCRECLPAPGPGFPVLAALPRALPAWTCRRRGAPRFPAPGETGVLPRGLPPCSVGALASPACERARSLALLVRGTQDQAHGPRERLPLRLFGDELSAPEWREAIVPGAFAFVRKFPRSRDPTFRLQPVQRRVQGTRLNLQQIFGSALNVFRDGVAVLWLSKQRAED